MLLAVPLSVFEQASSVGHPVPLLLDTEIGPMNLGNQQALAILNYSSKLGQ